MTTYRTCSVCGAVVDDRLAHLDFHIRLDHLVSGIPTDLQFPPEVGHPTDRVHPVPVVPPPRPKPPE